MKIVLIGIALMLFALAGVCLIASIVLFLMAKKRAAAASAPEIAPRPGAPSVAAPPPSPRPQAPFAPDRNEMLSPVTMPGSVDTAATVVVKLPQREHGSIVWLSGPLEGRRVPLSPEGFYIGRDGSLSELVLESSSVSKRHAWLGMRDQRPVIADAGSTNGTFLEHAPGQRITEHHLRDGDVVVIADNIARFRYEA